ncbi:MAG: oligogalacturonide lyase [Anaerolineaceae bacterium]|nr:oligogalacturonide lyase [Anaerolineaceae bacterium]
MSKGRVYTDERFQYEDPFSGRVITQLTDHLGHSNHFYFTDPCWFNDGQSMLFNGDREGRRNLFRYDFDDGKITQMTDLQGKGGTPRACISIPNNCAYYWWGRQAIELNLTTLAERVLYEVPTGMDPWDRTNPTADGQYVITKIAQAAPKQKASISFAYSEFRAMMRDKPLTQLVRIDIATGAAKVLHEDHRYLNHINTSPTLPQVTTFCHEGPWNLIDQRIWGLNVETGDVWKIRPQDDGKNFAVGHEYWFADGERIGYHGRPRIEDNASDKASGEHVFGYVKWDNSDLTEVRFPFHSTHFQSLDEKLIVGDGSPFQGSDRWKKAEPFIQLFKWNGEQYVGPRILAYHRSTFNDQYAHPHPRFTPDGKYVLYSSDLTHYANMYLVEVGVFDDLPLLTDDTPARPDMLQKNS